ncbi:MAG: hypothetical protein KGH59_01775 [Candidatus Micrarchaeota archaeon]|nr:hypothetical protein [Candidatus Micrarchaeota archaeon]MDE1804492.1 hypothetical protein [Candidatus Micrarchaeota archaeon]MDE1846451.1 hypothetical protein [Candidatus Micrarchaeota archaeon]
MLGHKINNEDLLKEEELRARTPAELEQIYNNCKKALREDAKAQLGNKSVPAGSESISKIMNAAGRIYLEKTGRAI